MIDELSTRPEAAVYRFDEFTFDCGSRQLLCDGTERHLSPKALQLLELLLDARPRAISRKKLYDALWPSIFVSETNLTSIINELRRALGDDGRRYIRTIHGFGYAFASKATSTGPRRLTTFVMKCHGFTYKLPEGESIIGRALDCRITIDDKTISRRHAVVVVAGGTVSIKDLDSRNGTFVDRRPVGSTPVVIKPGMHIELGIIAAAIEERVPSSTSGLALDVLEVQRQVRRPSSPPSR